MNLRCEQGIGEIQRREVRIWRREGRGCHQRMILDGALSVNF
jgi:hypothetical protein